MDTQKIVDNILGKETKKVKQMLEQDEFGIYYKDFDTIQHPKSGNVATLQIQIKEDDTYPQTQMLGIISDNETDEIYLKVNDMKENYEKLKDKLYMDLPKIKEKLLKELG